MKLRLTVFSAIIMVCLGLQAQQRPVTSTYMYNGLTLNPAYAGSSGGLCGSLLYRNQWTGFEGAPKTGLLSVDVAVNPLHGGLGLTVMAADELGFEKPTPIQAKTLPFLLESKNDLIALIA